MPSRSGYSMPHEIPMRASSSKMDSRASAGIAISPSGRIGRVGSTLIEKIEPWATTRRILRRSIAAVRHHPGAARLLRDPAQDAYFLPFAVGVAVLHE